MDECMRDSALIDGAALQAAVILSSHVSLTFEQSQACMVSENSINAWEDSLKTALYNQAVRDRLILNAEGYCVRYFDGSTNEQVLDDVMQTQKYAGTLLREERYRKIISGSCNREAGFISSIISVCQQHAKKQIYCIISKLRCFTIVSRLYARLRSIPVVWNFVERLRLRG
jgi:hypothetical protein